MKFTIHQSSRQGGRPYNQDRLAYSYSKDALLLVVADGMGGRQHGEIAAHLAVKTLTDTFQRLAVPTLSSPARFLTENIQQVHDMIANNIQTEHLIEKPGTTVVAAIIQRGVLYCAHVGDSRLYHYRDGHLLFRTEDHSIVQALFNRGVIKQDDMAQHPYRNRIYNCLGGEETPKVELSDKHELLEGDTILLCTDGIWGVVDDDRIKELLHTNEIDQAIIKLLDEAEINGGDDSDNMSLIGLQWGDRQSSNFVISTLTMQLGTTTTIMNQISELENDQNMQHDLTDDVIEDTIAEIQAALNNAKQGRKLK
ncbi:MAG: serine/threonine-protein phosphatase [Methylophilaceae bacterium]|nr:serine/threonine-protein phosphatase [Methylophilaceae bacterium]